jgi:hypothetical protein
MIWGGGGSWVESLWRIGQRGMQAVDALAAIVHQAVKYDKTTPPRRRTFGWLRRALLEDISVAFQHGNAPIMQNARAGCVPALAPVEVGAAAQAMPSPAGQGAGPGRGTVGMVVSWRLAGTGPSTGGCGRV